MAKQVNSESLGVIMSFTQGTAALVKDRWFLRETAVKLEV